MGTDAADSQGADWLMRQAPAEARAATGTSDRMSNRAAPRR